MTVSLAIGACRSPTVFVGYPYHPGLGHFGRGVREGVINKVRSTIDMDKSDPNVAAAVAELREASNLWVAKYRRDKASPARPAVVSGHYISFGPTAPIPDKRKARILEEMDAVEKALLVGR